MRLEQRVQRCLKRETETRRKRNRRKGLEEDERHEMRGRKPRQKKEKQDQVGDRREER